MTCCIELLANPPALDAVSVTLKTCGLTNVCTGFCALLNVPSPNDQFQLTAPPVEVSVKVASNGTVPDRGVTV